MKTKFLKSITGLMFFCLMSFFTLNMQAQSKPAKGERAGNAKKHIEKMTADLDLTETQVEEVQVVLKKYAPQLKEIREGEADREAKSAQMKEVKTQIDAELATILTPEQLTKHESMKKERRGGKGRRGGQRGK